MSICKHQSIRFSFPVDVPVYLENGRLVVQFDPDPQDETCVECAECGYVFNRGDLLEIEQMVNDAWDLAYRKVKMSKPESFPARVEDLEKLQKLVESHSAEDVKNTGPVNNIVLY